MTRTTAETPDKKTPYYSQTNSLTRRKNSNLHYEPEIYTLPFFFFNNTAPPYQVRSELHRRSMEQACTSVRLY